MGHVKKSFAYLAVLLLPYLVLSIDCGGDSLEEMAQDILPQFADYQPEPNFFCLHGQIQCNTKIDTLGVTLTTSKCTEDGILPVAMHIYDDELLPYAQQMATEIFLNLMDDTNHDIEILFVISDKNNKAIGGMVVAAGDTIVSQKWFK